jgi:glycosyltransferase involved in cell wall biosynthesis
VRILRINGWNGPIHGGAETYVRRISATLNAQGHTDVVASIVTHPPSPDLGPLRTFMLPRSEMVRAVRTRVGMGNGGLRRWLDGLAEEVRPDLIHLHAFRHGYLDLASWIAGRTEPVVFTVHDTELVCPIATLTLPSGAACPGGILDRCATTGCPVGRGLPLQLIKRMDFDTHVNPRVRSFICVSEATRAIFEANGYRPTELLRPMIPVPDAPAPVPSAPFTVGYLGRLERQKGIAVLLDAFALLRESIPGARLRIAGSGPFPVPEDDGVRVDGWVTDRYSWFGGIHVLVAPSYPWENLGNSPIEALAHGVPAIVTASGGLPETVGRFGTVVPPGDFRSLASALQVVAGCYNDERSVALEGREWVREEFSPEKHVERLLAIYRRA